MPLRTLPRLTEVQISSFKNSLRDKNQSPLTLIDQAVLKILLTNCLQSLEKLKPFVLTATLLKLT